MSASVLAGRVGSALMAAREAAGRTRPQVAQQLGMSTEVLARVERGDVNSTLERLERVALAYGVELHVSAVPAS